jgi:copper transport protein
VRRLVVVVTTSLALSGAWVAVAAVASGHASLKESVPANGELLEESPGEVRISFTEPPDVGLTIVEIVDGSGGPVPTGPVRIVPGTDREVAVAIEDLADGVYTVAWRTVSRADGHLTSGAFSFGVGVAAEEVVPVEREAGEETPPPTALAVAGRWGLYAGLAVLLGGALTGLLAFGPRASTRPWIVGLAWFVAAAGTIVMTLEERRVVGVPLGTLLGSDAGGAFVRLGIAVLVVGVAALVAALRPTTVTLVLLAAAAAAAMVVRAAGGHAGAAIQIVLQGGHFAAVGTWIGGLAWLVGGIRRGLEASRLRRFSSIAAWGLLVVVVTGFLRATDELGGFGWLLRAFDTDYGTTLVLKLAIVAPLVGLGAVNRFRNVRRFDDLGERPLRRTVAGELVLAGAVLAMTGVLTGLPPQVEPPAPPPRAPAPLVVSGSDFATTTRVRLEISPGTVGANAFVAAITDFDTGEPIDARRVTLDFSLPDRPEVSSTLELERGDDDTWQAGATTLSLEGTWDVDVLVETSGGSIEVPLEVTPKPSEQRVDVSRAEGQPDLYTIHLDDGVSIQAYVDPGVAGRPNQLHVTAFDAAGMELPLHHVAVEIAPEDGRPTRPELMQLSPGHFVANMDVVPGPTTFRIETLTADGRTLVGAFEQTFD